MNARTVTIRTAAWATVFVVASALVVEAGFKMPKLPTVKLPQKEEPAASAAEGSVPEGAAEETVDLSSLDAQELTAEQGLTAKIKALKGDNLLKGAGLVSTFVSIPRKNFLEANALLAEAVGLKNEADKLKAEAEALGSGTVSTKDLEKVNGNTEEALAAVEKVLSSSQPLAEGSGELYRSGCSKMRKAIVQEAGLIGVTAWLAIETAQQAKKLKDEYQEASGLGKAKLFRRVAKFTAGVAATAYLAKQIPGDVRAGRKTLKLARQYGKNNNIEIKELDDAEMDKLLAEADEKSAEE